MPASPDPSVQYLFYVYGAYQKTHSGVSDYYCYDDLNGLMANGFTMIGEIAGGTIRANAVHASPNGKPDSLWVSYWDNGQLDTKGNHKDGEQDKS